ncbi:hypothetical protein JN531_003890 [Flagellatimonas centrodinii]|uniref:hypothetical protein n=1 Tax=Flagellatimonas centrodinii TaxID=2806210 RepID=UPI001FEF64A3|nr:hypothetical protein [Flagellatimonas centrodinii]ULQ47429.1 hypothetical protein JN531_003890 [Flagellatimonas centrodinii]
MSADNAREIDPITAESGTVALLNRGEIDMQIETARRYPRSLKRFRDETLQMVTLTQQIAGECIYSLPRDGKVIEGPSARFAEVIASAWGNCRAGARVVSDQGDFVTAQGVFHDLERNVAITYEVQRRIVDKHGRRFTADMIGVTANAACSIGLRNAILKGVPKAFWSDMYQAARKVVMGDVRTLNNRRAECFEQFQRFGVTEAQILDVLNVRGKEDITIEHMVTLAGMLTAIRDGDSTPEQMFGSATSGESQAPSKPRLEKPPYTDAAIKANSNAWTDLIASGRRSAADIVAMVESKSTLTDAQRKTILSLGTQQEPEHADA